MNAMVKTAIVEGLTPASGLLGFLVQWIVPMLALTDGKGMVGSIIGLVTVLLALVLGLLVRTSSAVYTKQVDESQSLGPVVLQLDFALERYGPDAKAGRDLLRGLVTRARSRFWGGGGLGRPGSIYVEALATSGRSPTSSQTSSLRQRSSVSSWARRSRLSPASSRRRCSWRASSPIRRPCS